MRNVAGHDAMIDRDRTIKSCPETDRSDPRRRNRLRLPTLGGEEDQIMDFTRGALLWLLGVPLPIILLIALFWHH